MSPFAIVVILILAGLFIIMSLIPLMDGSVDKDSPQTTPRTQTKGIH